MNETVKSAHYETSRIAIFFFVENANHHRFLVVLSLFWNPQQEIAEKRRKGIAAKIYDFQPYEYRQRFIPKYTLKCCKFVKNAQQEIIKLEASE